MTRAGGGVRHILTFLTVFCRKFSLLLQFLILWGVKVLGNVGNITLKVFFVYFMGILMILSFLLYFLDFAALSQIWYCQELRTFCGKIFEPKIRMV